MDPVPTERIEPASKTRIRVLILEDNPSDADLMMDALKQAGFDPQWERVETEADYAARLTLDVDLILSDYSLPQFNGVQALQLVRSRGLDVPFILVSGSIGEDIAVETMREGADDYLLKDRMARLGPAARHATEAARLRKDNRSVEETRRRLVAILEATPDFVGIADASGNAVYLNRAGRKMVGLEQAEDITGMTIPDFSPAWANEIILNTGVPAAIRDGTWVGETARLHRDGREVPVSQVIISHKNEKGQIEYLSTIARDITERRRAERIMAVLSGVNSAIVRIHDRQQLLEEACRIAAERGNFKLVWLGTLDRVTLSVRPTAWAGLDEEFLSKLQRVSAREDVPEGHGAIGQALRTKKTVLNNDIAGNPLIGPMSRYAVERGVRSLISLPLLVEGEAEGIFVLYANETGFFTEDEVRVLQEVASNLSFALEHIARQQRIEKLSRLRAVSSAINSAIVRIRERQVLFEETCRIAAEHGEFELVWIALLDQDKQQVQPVAWVGFSPEAAHAVSWTTIGTARGTLGEAIQTRKVAIRNDIDAGLPGGMLRQEALQKGCLSTVCLPLVVDDNVVALIALFAAGRGFFDEGELALLNEVAADVSFALQSIAKQEKLEYLSYYDVLTGLPNRHLFVDRLNQQMRSRSGEPQMVTLVLLDLERFRNINESLGHHGGDELLKTIARRLEHAFHGKDYLARIGSNAFGAIVRGMRDATGVVHVVENDVFTCFGQPFIVSDRELRVSVKAGIAIFPADGEDADNLFRNAEAALRQAKTSGNRYLFYAAEMNSRATQILALETRLRKAVEAEQFVLHYQPKLDLASGRISGLEALIRWNDPETGLVPPAQFIPLLEETGMIVGAGQWAIRRALADYREWQKEGLQPPRIAVNVSPIQLKRKDFVDVVRAAISDSTAAAHGLDLEITESMIMEDIEGNIEKLRLLRDMGANTAIDDFGTGYSSLAYLAKLPVNALKIDRSFIVTMVDSPDSMTIVATIISLAHSLSLKVIAEGVETEEQSRFLKLLKCDEMQGYLFSKPLPAADIRTMLRERRGS